MFLLIALTLFVLVIFLFIKFIIKKDRGHKEPLGALFIAMGFGFLAVILAFFLEDLFIPQAIEEGLNAGKNIEMGFNLLQASLMIGIVEEGVKAIPLALFIFKRKYFDELTDGVIYFGITALTFGMIENIAYGLSYGIGTGIFRIIFLPYLHAGFTILFGISLAYKKVLNKSWLVVIAGFASAVLVHAIYDYFAFTGGLGMLVVLIITVGLNIMLFVLFKKAQKGDEARGQSSLGANNFCQFCGKPNPKNMLYCSFCGKRT